MIRISRIAYLYCLWICVLILVCCEEGQNVNPNKSEASGNDGDESSASDADADGDSDADGDGDGDADIDRKNDEDAASDSNADSDSEKQTNKIPNAGDVKSYIWISGTGNGTLSKVDTITAEEVARYRSSPLANGDPSRTSVNLHGDMVVTNRQPVTGRASVTKFAADPSDCIDRNGNGKIDTSQGPKDILPWGEDECMIWNTPIGGPNGGATGARGTAWDGSEDPDTGKGGHVFVGTTGNRMVYKFDGDTGEILAQNKSPIGAYGGVVDGKRKGSFWIVAFMCTSGTFMPGMGQGGCSLGQVDMETLETKTVPFGCGYGITIDPKGRVWTAGMGLCFGRYNPKTEEKKIVQAGGANRGIAADRDGSVWAANTAGTIVQLDQETMKVIKNTKIGNAVMMIGIAVDFEGNVWGVSQGTSRAYKMNPKTYDFTPVPIAPQPYTYSDMTGMQLRGVVPVVVK